MLLTHDHHRSLHIGQKKLYQLLSPGTDSERSSFPALLYRSPAKCSRDASRVWSPKLFLISMLGAQGSSNPKMTSCFSLQPLCLSSRSRGCPRDFTSTRSSRGAALLS